MKNRVLIGCLLLLSICSVLFLYHYRVEADSRTEQSVEGDAFSHDLFDQVLQEHVDENGQVNYTTTEGESREIRGVSGSGGCGEPYGIVL